MLRHWTNVLVPIALVLSSLLAAPAFGGSKAVYVAPVTTGGLSLEDRSAVEELIRVAVGENSGFLVATEAKSADLILTAQLLKLGSAYILTLQKKDNTGKVLFSEKMKASDFADMDTVASRLTSAVLGDKRIAATADVTNITEQEEKQGSRRFHATRQWVTGLGPGWSSNLGSGGGGFTFVLGYLWGLDPDFSINLSWTHNSGPGGDESSFSDFSIGGEYYLSREKHSPFIGGRFGYGSADVNQDECGTLSLGECDDAKGWGVNATIGYKLFRTSTVNAALLLTMFTLFDETTLGRPNMTSVQFAVYY